MAYLLFIQYMEKLLRIWLFLCLFGIIWYSVCHWAYDNPKDYLQYCWLTDIQTQAVIDKTSEVKNPDHFIKRFGAIFAHENWWNFIDWSTRFLAGRLKKWMEYKDFNTQLDGWVNTYNKYRYKNNTTSDRIDRSNYCISDTHWWWQWCPNWKKNLPAITALYKPSEFVYDDITDEPIHTVAQDEREPLIKKWTPKTKIKTICRQESLTVKKWEYLKITFAGKVRQWITNLWAWDTIEICRDVA